MAGLQDIAPIVAALMGDEGGARADPGGGRSGLDAGMAAADDDDVEESGCVVHGID